MSVEKECNYNEIKLTQLVAVSTINIFSSNSNPKEKEIKPNSSHILSNCY